MNIIIINSLFINIRYSDRLLKEAEVVAECLAFHTRQYTTARGDIFDISGN